MLDVIEHVDDDLEALRSVRAAMKPGGQILVTVPALDWLWSRTCQSFLRSRVAQVRIHDSDLRR